MTSKEKAIALVVALFIFARRSSSRAAAQASPMSSSAIQRATSEVSVPDADSSWTWPVPTLVTGLLGGARFPAVITSGFGDPRQGHTHAGVDIMYRRDNATVLPQFKPGTHDSPRHASWAFAPPKTPVLAARSGRVWSTTRSRRGWMVVLDHGAPWSTLYQHLEDIAFPIHRDGKRVDGGPAIVVPAGGLLGTMGYSLEDAEQLRHLHFEVHKNMPRATAIDPAEMMATWGRTTWQPTTL